LTDGTVLAHSEPNCLSCTSTDYSSWYKLTPDSNGSSSMDLVEGLIARGLCSALFRSLCFLTAVWSSRAERRLLDWNCNAAWTNKGAIYDPVKKSGLRSRRPTVGRPSAMLNPCPAQRNLHAGKLLH